MRTKAIVYTIGTAGILISALVYKDHTGFYAAWMMSFLALGEWLALASKK